MALIMCPECLKDISEYASQCPHCGYRLNHLAVKETEKVFKSFLTVILILVCLVGGFFAFRYIKYKNQKSTILSGYPYSGNIESGYGWREDPVFKKPEYHTGIDIAVPYKSELIATGDGVVKKAGWSGSYGLKIVINHTNSLSTLYAHCTEILVKIGDVVKKGQVIAYAGATGSVTHSQVHYEILCDGKPIDPVLYYSGNKAKNWFSLKILEIKEKKIIAEEKKRQEAFDKSHPKDYSTIEPTTPELYQASAYIGEHIFLFDDSPRSEIGPIIYLWSTEEKYNEWLNAIIAGQESFEIVNNQQMSDGSLFEVEQRTTAIVKAKRLGRGSLSEMRQVLITSGLFNGQYGWVELGLCKH